MLTDRLTRMIAVSVFLAAFAAVLGHVGALAVPAWFGYQSTSTAGMMAVAAGVILLFAIVFAPQHGVVVKLVRQRLLAWGILAEDIIGLLYRIDERGGTIKASTNSLRDILISDRISTRAVLSWLGFRKEIKWSGDVYHLTPRGRARAQGLVRSHRLWEQYLASYAEIDTRRVHDKAERFEHFTESDLRERLGAATDAPDVDPHGQPIPTVEKE